MDEVLIHNWNERVSVDDIVYHLGDVSFRSPQQTVRTLARLNGTIHIILGNHDKTIRKSSAVRERFESVSELLEIDISKQHIVLCHYAMRTWNRSHHGSWHLYGHSHGNLTDDPNARSMDVGVDPNDYCPVHVDEIARHMKKKDFRAVDHHGR